jgi:hypothetical protein
MGALCRAARFFILSLPDQFHLIPFFTFVATRRQESYTITKVIQKKQVFTFYGKNLFYLKLSNNRN